MAISEILYQEYVATDLVLLQSFNVPTIVGAMIECQAQTATGTGYAMIRTDRAWYSLANGDAQGQVDADTATIIAGDTTDPDMVWADGTTGATTMQFTVTGFDQATGPYYVGWVQEDAGATSNILNDEFTTTALTLTGEANTPTGVGATITVESNSTQGALYSYSKLTPFNGSESENVAAIIANAEDQVPVVGVNIRTIIDQPPGILHYVGWVQVAGAAVSAVRLDQYRTLYVDLPIQTGHLTAGTVGLETVVSLNATIIIAP